MPSCCSPGQAVLRGVMGRSGLQNGGPWNCWGTLHLLLPQRLFQGAGVRLVLLTG